MDLALHIGATCTDDDRLLRTLLKNAAMLSGRGINVPTPGTYRRQLRELVQDGDLPEDARMRFLSATGASGGRLVLSHPQFLCVANRVFEDGAFYALADAKIARAAQIFAEDRLHFFLGLRNPASFVPAAFAEAKAENLSDFLSAIPLAQIRWAGLVRRIRAAAPAAKLTVWCNEDTPIIWGTLVRQMAGIDNRTGISGGYDMIAEVLTSEGTSGLSAFLKANPPSSEAQKRKVLATFLEKYEDPAKTVEEFDLPGWTDEIVAALTAQYDADVAEIEAMPDVTFIAP